MLKSQGSIDCTETDICKCYTTWKCDFCVKNKLRPLNADYFEREVPAYIGFEVGDEWRDK